MNNAHKKIYLLIVVLTLLVNLAGINSRFFTDDPGLYASIAKQLIYHHDFFQLFSYGRDWLDKPHLPFWIVLCSFKLFGIHTWSYKLPALLCFLLAALYTWLFAKKYYGQQTAAMAVLILSTSLHLMMSNTDVRAEPYLMAFIIGSIYHIARLNERFSTKHLLLSALFTAFAIMTKGIFVLTAIGGSLLGQIILQKKFKSIFSLKWLALILLTVLFTLPELYALYIQFDVHPEKTVFGKQGVSGIKWFLWDSQFGRFANNGPITRPAGDVFFFIHTLLWAFAPWCLLFFYSVFKSIRALIKRMPQPEYYTLSGALFLWLLFSLSGFQLPFYTNILFPLFAIITARFCNAQITNKAERIFRFSAQWCYIILLPITILLINYYLKSANSIMLITGIALCLLMIILIFTIKTAAATRVFFLSCVVMVFVNFYLNVVLYPVIIENKGQLKAADYVNEPGMAKYNLYSVLDQNNVFQFYSNRPVGLVTTAQFAGFKPALPSLFYVNQPTIKLLQQQNAEFRIIQQFTDYPQESVFPDFINARTRSGTLENVYLITKP